MRHALHAEWTKLRTVPSTPWLVLTAFVFTVLVGAAAANAVDTTNCPTPAECYEDITKVSLTGVQLGQIAVVVLAVLAMTSEYGTRMIQTTLAVNPRRANLLLAKAGVVTATVLTASIPSVLVSLGIGRAVLPGNGFTEADGYPPISLTDGPTLRAAVGSVLYLGLVALFSLGIATAVRDTAGAITTVLLILYSGPLVAAFVSDPRWHERLEKYAPMTAGLSVQATANLNRLAIGPWAGLGVFAAYAAAAMLLGAILFKTRDA